MAENVTVANALLAAWLQEQYPELFADLARRAAPANLSGFTDTLRAVGGAIGTAASKVVSGLSTVVQSVGNFIGTPEGQSVLSTLAAAKLQSSANQIVSTQVARANAGIPPAPIGTAYDPATNTYVPVVSTVSGQTLPLDQRLLSSLQPSFLDKYGVWLIGGGVGLVLVAFMLRRG
jgi:hypothetical protein